MALPLRRFRPGEWYQGRGVGQAAGTAPGCDYPGGIYARDGETEEQFFARSAVCIEATELLEASGEDDAAWNDFWNRQADRLTDELFDSIFGEEDKPRTTPRPGLSTGAKVAIGVGAGAAVITLTVVLVRALKK
jgi:hypothetical protein